MRGIGSLPHRIKNQTNPLNFKLYESSLAHLGKLFYFTKPHQFTQVKRKS